MAVLPNTVPVSHAQLTQDSRSPRAAPHAANRRAVLAISHDERLSVHEFTDAATDDETPGEAGVETARSVPTDLRSYYECDYAVGLKTWARGDSRPSGLLLALGAYKR